MKLRLLGLIAFALIVVACGARQAEYDRIIRSIEYGSSGEVGATAKIKYEITGTNVTAVSLTWENDTGGTEQGDYKLPFRETYTMEWGDFVYISAQIIQPTSGAGKIECRIYIENVEVYYAQASGFPSIASCSGLVE